METTIFLTLAEVIEIHADQIKRFGGDDGIRGLDLLSSGVAMPSATLAAASP